MKQLPHRAILQVDRQALKYLCRKWRIARLEVFGSVLRADFRADSDIDLLVTFEPGIRWSFFQLYRAESEFSALFGRKVELISREGVERSANYIRRKAILESAEVLYAA
ncbi:MAG: nucleotidyltransferase domain-containing protein [Armatimonadota bacterium]